ncbi:MAG TPA: AbrB/MazE/SpoVT family DNA-binding domain-containing protein [Planctomycetota bacterium]|nr:AbrB/MazE/SpoVT family DNA-binding domain-containing protein [Planctomycetota bacterium]
MLKRLVKHGNSLALVIDRGVLDLLEIDAETPLAITTDGECLVVSPVRDEKRRARFEEAVREGNRRYGRALRRLAE